MMKTSSKARLFGFGLATLMLTGAAHAGATEIWRTTGFSSPESVAWDAAAGLFYVSNMGADPMAADGDGYISTLGADGKVIADKWATGMNAPKGLAAVGGKLYTADLTDLVEIDTATGAITNRYPAAGAVFLNDVVAAPDGRIFVSDTFGNSVWVLENGAMSLDASQGFDKIKPGMVVSIDLTSKVITPYGSTEPSGVLDGVEADGKGGVLFTDNMGGRLMQQSPGGAAAEVAKLEPGAADMAVVLDQGLILVPLTPANTVVGLKWTE
jgi:DNA-binding beta-propeller fold protein YncE